MARLESLEELIDSSNLSLEEVSEILRQHVDEESADIAVFYISVAAAFLLRCFLASPGKKISRIHCLWLTRGKQSDIEVEAAPFIYKVGKRACDGGK